MKNWSNKQHEKMLQEKRRKKREKTLSASFDLNRNALPTTVYLDNTSEEQLSTVMYTNNGIDYYDGKGNKIV